MTTPETTYALLLVNPKRRYRFNWDLKEVTAIMGKKTVGHPLALPLLAAMTPAHYNVRIVDEELEPLPGGPLPDLVGITGLISNIQRAYEIADAYREKGVLVVMGGPQVTFDVDTALAHADSVVVGEAEKVWDACLRDFENGAMAPVYRSSTLCEFEESPIPRWDLLDTSKMLTFSVQVSRGCPYRCDFCLVRKLFGKGQRYRRIDNVIEEIEALPPDAQIAFADDNLTADKAYTRELMNRLIPLRRSWSCQASLDVTQDEALLGLMSEAGCNSILVGFETLNPSALKEAGKFQNKLSKYETGIENAHRAGIHILGSFVAGFESDTLETFEEIDRFTQQTGLSFVMINALSAYPGTDLYDRMGAAGRITKINPDLCNGIYPTMHYRHISQEEMFFGILSTLDNVYSFETLSDKAPAVLGNGGFQNRVQPPISFWVKLRSTLHVLFRYALSPNRYKRLLFSRLFGLIRSKRTDVGVVIQYLLFISSIHGYQLFNQRQGKTLLKELRANDQTRPPALDREDTSVAVRWDERESLPTTCNAPVSS